MQGYLLLGPSSAKRNNCSGLLTIAERMMDAASHIKISPPAKEERSNVLVLTCGAKGVLRMKEVFCYPPSLEEFLQVMENYINITHRLSVIARVPRVSDDLFPEEDTYSGQMTHGITDMRFSYVAINERRAFSTDFFISPGLLQNELHLSVTQDAEKQFHSPEYIFSHDVVLLAGVDNYYCCGASSCRIRREKGASYRLR
ncbi:hypothetical protein MRX96_035792 [Rhipicephalus microplus]